MRKRVIFFDHKPPLDQTAIHVWLGRSNLSHPQCLCKLIGQYLGSCPITLAKASTGKLYLPNSPLHFNLSDAEDWIAVAFSWEAPVGIDIEVIRPIEGMQQLILEYFSPREQAYIQEKDNIKRFWEIWNRKEACCKALGLGLQDNMSEWDCYGQGWIEVKNVWVRSIPIKKNLSAAVAFYCK